MNVEDAIKELKIQRSVLEDMVLYNRDFNSNLNNGILEYRIKVFDRAIRALEKRIPKAPIKVKALDGVNDYFCAKCLRIIGDDKHKYRFSYCPDCGQAVALEVEE